MGIAPKGRRSRAQLKPTVRRRGGTTARGSRLGPLGVWAAGAIVMVSIAACGASTTPSGAKLELDGKINVGTSGQFGYVKSDGVVSFGSVPVCLSHPGRATITEVRPYHRDGELAVQTYAVRRNPYLTGSGELYGGARSTLRAQGFSSGRVVTAKCGMRDGEAVMFELGIQLRKHSTYASAAGWIVYWKSKTASGHFYVPVAIALCPGSPTTKACKASLDKATSA